MSGSYIFIPRRKASRFITGTKTKKLLDNNFFFFFNNIPFNMGMYNWFFKDAEITEIQNGHLGSTLVCGCKNFQVRNCFTFYNHNLHDMEMCR